MSGSAPPWYARRSAVAGALLVALATIQAVSFYPPSWEQQPMNPKLGFGLLLLTLLGSVGGTLLGHAFRREVLGNWDTAWLLLAYPAGAWVGIAVPDLYRAIFVPQYPGSIVAAPWALVIGGAVGVAAEAARWD